MKPVKNSLFAVLLVFAITGTIVAGEVPIPPAPPRATAIAPEDEPITTPTLSDPYSEPSGETVETTDYLLFETFKALLFTLY